MPSVQSILVAGLFAASTVLAQSSIIPSSQPTCIQSCTLFTQAQQACSGDQGQASLYQSCFCQSAYLATIKTTPSNNICPNCASSDWSTIASWYNGLCGSNAAAAGGQTTLQTTTTTAGSGSGGATTSTTAGAAATTSADGTADSADSADNPANYTDSASWFKSHYQWVIMIIVLAVAFAAIGVIGTIWHKKKSRSAQRGLNNTGPMRSNPAVNASWAPSRQSVHDFGSPARAASPTAPPVPGPSQPGSRRDSRRLARGSMR